MGQWNITIQGHGIHDNGSPDDANVLLARFLDDLKSAGHEVEHVAFTVGSAHIGHMALLEQNLAAARMRQHRNDSPAVMNTSSPMMRFYAGAEKVPNVDTTA